MFVMDGEKIGDKKKVDATEETYRLLNIMERVQISNFPGPVLMNRRNEMTRKEVPPGSTLRESRISRILENFFPISLLDLDLKAFPFHFSLSISISRHFTFHSLNE